MMYLLTEKESIHIMPSVCEASCLYSSIHSGLVRGWNFIITRASRSWASFWSCSLRWGTELRLGEKVGA